MDPSVLPHEDEQLLQALWDTFVKDYEADVCFPCCSKKNMKKWPFLMTVHGIEEVMPEIPVKVQSCVDFSPEVNSIGRRIFPVLLAV